MKKKYNIQILLAFLILGISSCSSDNSAANEEPNLITAKWFLAKSSFKGVPHDLTTCDKKAYIEFTSNGLF